MQWSEYQEAIFAAVSETNDSLLVEAVAGSGKTTTLVELINRVPSGQKVIFLAFNKRIAEELKSRVDSRKAQCRTLHSVGNTAWQGHLGFDGPAVIDGRKVQRLMDEVMTYPQRMKYAQMAKLIALAKGAGIAPSMAPTLARGLALDVDTTWQRIIDTYEIEGFIDERTGKLDKAGIDFARQLLVRSIETSKRVIDFDDQLYMPVVTGVAFEKFDVVLLDEAQDVNSMQCEIVSRLLAPGGRVIAVGDRHQACYGFRGAMTESMDHIAQRFGCKPLPLSVSYRCPKKVVEVARGYVSHILHHDAAPEGVVQSWDQWDVRKFRADDAILCRLNAPLVSVAFSLIRHRVPCRIIGRDIANGLVALVKRMKAQDVAGLLAALSAYLRREALRHPDDPSAIARAQDKVDTLHVFIDELAPSDTLETLMGNITWMFQDLQAGAPLAMLSLSTVHKAKGLEFDRVFILDADQYMPLPWAKAGWQLEQETNIIYIAVTRAKKELHYVTSAGLGIPQVIDA